MHTEIQYALPTKQVFSLSPLYSNPEEFQLIPFSNVAKITKDVEILEKNEWALIDGFKEMSSNVYPNEEKHLALPSPLEIMDRLDILREGILYRPKVRLIKYG